MPKLKWKYPDERYTCYSEDGENFYGAYWKKLDGGWLAHINPLGGTWYLREFPEGTSEKKVKKECQNLINHYDKENKKWELD